MLMCRDCGREQPEDNFYQKNGRVMQPCKSCCADRARRNRLANHEQYKARKRAYYERTRTAARRNVTSGFNEKGELECRVCHKWCSLAEMIPDANSKHGVQHFCRSCARARDKLRRNRSYTERAYLAGLVDASGYFNLRIREQGGPKFVACKLAITAPSLEVATQLAEDYAGRLHRTGTAVYVEWDSRAKIKSLLESCRHYLRARREHADCMIRFAESGDVAEVENLSRLYSKL